ncbi:hypothetical protein K3495_g8084 [Podosphaera aphanis]|nr:hypothetical protein K3495_g8084 [Podosphaera aphanis]
MAIRSDNAAEIREKLNEWSKHGVRHEFTVSYEGSHQNGIAERKIQQVESGIRSSLKDAGLPLEFWDWAAEHSTYLWNIMPHGPVVDGVRLTPRGAYEGIVPDVNHVRIFGCVCYSYISPKSWPAGAKGKRHLDRGRECVFVGHNGKTTNLYWVYTPDFGRTELAKTVDFDENRKGGDLDLKIRQQGGNTSQGIPSETFTSSTLPARRTVGRSTKSNGQIVATLPNFSDILDTDTFPEIMDCDLPLNISVVSPEKINNDLTPDSSSGSKELIPKSDSTYSLSTSGTGKITPNPESKEPVISSDCTKLLKL